MITARSLFYAARKAGITLALNGAKISFEAPSGAIERWKPVIERVRPEFIAMLDGDYLQASIHLVLRESVPGERRRELAEKFDQRLATCLAEDGEYDRACQQAYVAMAISIEESDGRKVADRRLA